MDDRHRGMVTCTQCGGREGGCTWCNHTGWMSYDRNRECQDENRRMDDDRDWARRNDVYRGPSV